jgi:hypothetical protein
MYLLVLQLALFLLPSLTLLPLLPPALRRCACPPPCPPPDKLFRINNVAKRKKYADLVEGVREAGGEALVFSSMHVSGEALNNLSGVAAILRFPLPELEDQELIEEI